tara:strand:- start:1322 stop:2137 length:816 start_codon:yes stop_codon:yes gene_type:complete
MIKKNRLDIHLLTIGLVESRQKAQRIILAGKVRDKNGKILDKPGLQVPLETQIDIISEPKFVSRGGDKLLEAFNQFPINVEDRICIDAGISTGGFSDCLLQKGAKKIYGIDVGYGQTAWKIRNNPRVKLLERTNIRYVEPSTLYFQTKSRADFVVADLSFISLKLALKPIINLLEEKYNEGVFLIKPQFEVSKEKVGKGGVVRGEQYHIEAIESVIKAATQLNWLINGLIASPLVGPAGNHEYLIWLGTQKITRDIFDHKFIKNLVSNTIG